MTVPATASAAQTVPPVDPDDGLIVGTSGLSKRFRSGQLAVNGVDLRVPRGAVYGFLGPNGSGKTTTIRMLLGLVKPTAGTITVLGHAIPSEVSAALPRVGAMIEGPAYHPYLTGSANLHRLDAMSATADPATRGQRIDDALARVGLGNAARKKFRQYSLGMKQRLGIAGALLEPRDLLVLDEPTNGLDPQGTREVRTLIRELAHDGTTVFVSSHLLTEIEQIATHIGILSSGQLVLQASLAELRANTATTLAVTTTDPGRAALVLREHGLQAVTTAASETTALLGDARPEDITIALVRAGVPVRGLAVRTRDLEDIFVGLTGEGFDVDR